MDRVRAIEAEEIGPWMAQLSAGFHSEVATGYPEYFLGTIELERALASFDGDRVVGTLRSFPTPLTVSGPRELRVGALTNVSVAPTHRRQGRLTAMIERDLRGSVDRGEPLSILIASEYPIYGRFGYGPATETAHYKVLSPEARFRDPVSGTVELTDRATLRTVAPDLYDRYRTGQPGAIERRADWWDRVLRQVEVPGNEPAKGQVALYRSPGGALEGYVIYEGKAEWEGMRPQGVLQLQDLLALTPAAYQALWSYCCGVDLLTSIEARERPVDEVLPYLLDDGRAVKQTGRFDFQWVRVLDVRAALVGRSYTMPGQVVLEVVDPLGHATGRFSLEGGPDGATCAATSASPDLTVPIDALGSLYLGGVAARTLLLGGRLAEHRDGAVSTVDAMFRSDRFPWCNTWF
jgi:predicted acetyltransferase